MGFRTDLLKTWDDFDKFLLKFSKESYIYSYAYMIRNLYEAYHENPDNSVVGYKYPKILYKIHAKYFQWKRFVSDVFSVFTVFTLKPVLSCTDKIILLEISHDKDKYVSDKLNIPLAKIKFTKMSFCFNNVRYFIRWLVVAVYLIREKNLNKAVIWKCLLPLLQGIAIYHQIELDGIETIITQQDRYPKELGILKRAKEQGIKTVKFDYFPITGRIGQNTIFCEYHFYSNKIAKDILYSFRQNHSVKFIEGGFPFWDSYADYNYSPVENPKVISFFTQHGFEKGLLGRNSPLFYIEEILSALPQGFILYVKIHPLDNLKKYMKYEADNVKIIKHGSIDNLKIYSLSSFVLSISSTISFEAKHICPSSYFINYTPDAVCDFNYNAVKDYIDLIVNRQELKEIIFGKKGPKDQARFIRYFNPNHPNTTQRLKEFIDSL